MKKNNNILKNDKKSNKMRKNSKKTSILLMFSLILFILILDLLSKNFVEGINKIFIPNFLSFLYSRNTGAAWGLLESSGSLLIIISIIAIILINIYAVFEKNNNKLLYISLGFVLGGAWGNLFDRIVFGYVRDFIRFEFIDFPTFNLADASLTVGVILLIVSYIIIIIKDRKQNAR